MTNLITDLEKQPIAEPTAELNLDSFRDEPKGDPEDVLDEAEFVSDDGEGNTSVMKPRKPTIHHRAVNHDKIQAQCPHDEAGLESGDESDDDDKEDLEQYRNSKYYIFSACVFVFSSFLYLGMACMVMDRYYHYADVPLNVMNADDDATWWNYFVNCTDDGFFPENVTNADDDYTWMEWYNETAFHEDDTVWLPKIANENAPGYEPYVSKYMLLYFWAALGFLITGVIEVILARKYFWYRMLYYLMIIAATLGMVSAVLTNKDPYWSNITNALSVHFWALEAIIIVVQRCKGKSFADDYDDDAHIFGISITKWFYIADFSFLIGTLGDCGTSYFYIFGIDNYKLGITAVVFAMGWLICAIVYLLIAIYDHNQYKIYFDYLGDERKRELGLIPGGVVSMDLDADKDGNGNGGGEDGSLVKKNSVGAVTGDTALMNTAHTGAMPESDLSFTVSQSVPTSSSSQPSLNNDPPEEREGKSDGDDVHLNINDEKKKEGGTTTATDADNHDDAIPENIDIVSPTTEDLDDKQCCM